MRKATLNLERCSAEDINNLPNMQVDGKVWLPDLRGNKEIKRIPTIESKVGGDLWLDNCESLTSLPKGLSVGGSLRIGDCKKLSSLPTGLKISEDLDICNCESLEYLPKDLKVKGNIWYNYKTGFVKIKGWKNDPEIIPTHLRDKFR